MECENLRHRRVKLGYVADCGTCVQLVDSIGNQVFDLLPVIQAGETDTSFALLTDLERLRYYPEEFTRTNGESGCYHDVCIKDIAALIDLNMLRNVESVQPKDGQTIIFNSETNQYEMYDLSGEVAYIHNRIDQTNVRIDNVEKWVTSVENNLNVQTRRIDNLFELVAALTKRVDDLTNRLSAIENAIYNWGADKNTKIPRATINVTSGGPNSNNIIQCRAKNQNNDLDFQ